MKARHIAAAFLIVTGCERQEPAKSAPAVEVLLPFPDHFDGAWVMSAGWFGYMGVALAVSGDRYYYWMYSDIPVDANYPYTGSFRINGDELILSEPSELATGKLVKQPEAIGLYSDRWRILRKKLMIQLQSATDAPDDHARTLLPDFQFDPLSPFQHQQNLQPESGPRE